MPDFSKQLDVSFSTMDKHTQKQIRQGFKTFLGVVAGIARRKMMAGETVNVRRGFLAASLKSGSTPASFKTSINESFPSGWNAKKKHLEKIKYAGDTIEGEIGTKVWYASILAKGGRAGKTGYIQGKPFIEPAINEAMKHIDEIFMTDIIKAA